MSKEKGIYTVGITGASGAMYGVCLTQELLRQSYKVHLVITEAGWQVFKEELQLDTSDRGAVLDELFPLNREQLHYHHLHDYAAPIASGSYKNNGMFIIPCSMGTLSGIAHGASGNLLERTADVMLKEKRPLLLVPRETPLHQIHLENMLTISKVGGTIVPAMPGYYQQPKTIEDLVRFVVGKVLDSAGIEHQLFTRWGGDR
ncbi:UbiX family flavin prenyltransferase [Alkalihalobacillus sp. LMS39]|uniref:UbiX family flavin prenyltransferase n=1 Tax=Alkalihalobacillus sp. LMS39 TaxID=2924032 RepID=UPI001FB46563|nr:UbiX family flavin prenyltransferase [Alkalihalobacillus sp. LMS39]UOE92343.1 UbiX family flavin prenyltransferase [Alkalihalobacillus sp. LMS39]